MARIEISTVTSNSISVYFSGLDANYQHPDRVCHWHLNGSKQGVSNIPAYQSVGGHFTFNGLTSGVTYQISCYIYVGSLNFQTITYYASATVMPNLWSWTSSNGSASSTQTQRAYTAVTNKGKTSDFSYLVWNDMVSKMREILTYKQRSWRNDYANYNATLMSSNDKILTAVRYNSLLTQINGNYATGLSHMGRGDKLFGSYLTRLATAMNGWLRASS